jgi:hypothetical protein
METLQVLSSSRGSGDSRIFILKHSVGLPAHLACNEMSRMLGSQLLRGLSVK